LESNDGNNNILKIILRNGHEVIFDDNEDGTKLVIQSSSGHSITLDDTPGGECIRVIDKPGNKIIMDAAQNAISLECDGVLRIKARIIEIEAEATIDINAGATVTMKGAIVQIN
jgi:hypothetical protein